MVQYVYKVYKGGVELRKATQRIIKKFPKLKEKIHHHENVLLAGQSLEELNDIQATFLQLAWFFEAPDKESFDLGYLYRRLNDDWLEFALELIIEYFREDTYLIQKPSFLLIKDGDGSKYLRLSQFANYLSEHGLPYDRQKLNLYYGRKKVPEPDFIIGGTKYWSLKSVQEFYKKEKTRLEQN